MGTVTLSEYDGFLFSKSIGGKNIMILVQRDKKYKCNDVDKIMLKAFNKVAGLDFVVNERNTNLIRTMYEKDSKIAIKRNSNEVYVSFKTEFSGGTNDLINTYIVDINSALYRFNKNGEKEKIGEYCTSK